MIAFITLIAVTLFTIWVRTRPAFPEPPGDKFNPYREDYEEGFDANYEPNNSWRKEYEHMN